MTMMMSSDSGERGVDAGVGAGGGLGAPGAAPTVNPGPSSPEAWPTQKTSPKARLTPIGRYNFERSTYRFLMSLHPAEFEAAGVLTTTLERTPLARQAFFESVWLGARLLVRLAPDGRYERTPFFDGIIQRELAAGVTRFDVKDLSDEERLALGIGYEETRDAGYYLTCFGSADRTAMAKSKMPRSTSVNSMASCSIKKSNASPKGKRDRSNSVTAGEFEKKMRLAHEIQGAAARYEAYSTCSSSHAGDTSSESESDLSECLTGPNLGSCAIQEPFNSEIQQHSPFPMASATSPPVRVDSLPNLFDAVKGIVQETDSVVDSKMSFAVMRRTTTGGKSAIVIVMDEEPDSMLPPTSASISGGSSNAFHLSMGGTLPKAHIEMPSVMGFAEDNFFGDVPDYSLSSNAFDADFFSSLF